MILYKKRIIQFLNPWTTYVANETESYFGNIFNGRVALTGSICHHLSDEIAQTFM